MILHYEYCRFYSGIKYFSDTGHSTQTSHFSSPYHAGCLLYQHSGVIVAAMKHRTSENINGSSSSSIGEPKRKRLRRCPLRGGYGWVRTTSNAKEHLALPDLPAELWSIIMNTLPYSSMIELSSTSRLMLKMVAPRVQKIQVEDCKELSPLVASRFTGVSSVDVACLFQSKDDGQKYYLCAETAGRIALFLQKFPSLREAWVGGLVIPGDSRSKIEYHHALCDEPECHEDIFDCLLDDFASFFECGLLPSDLKIAGITGSSWAHSNFRCIVDDDDETYRPGCKLCRDICHHFPLQHVVKMGYKEQYFNEHVFDMRWDQCINIDPPEGTVCFSHDERIAAIVERPGGKEILAKEAMPIALKRWLDVAEQLVRVNEFGWPSRSGELWDTALDLDNFSALSEIETVAPYVDVSVFDYETLIGTIVHQSKCSPLPKRGTLLIMKPTFDQLVSLGFPLYIDDFRCVVRREKGVTLGADYTDEAWEELDRLGVDYKKRYGKHVMYCGPGFDSL